MMSSRLFRSSLALAAALAFAPALQAQQVVVAPLTNAQLVISNTQLGSMNTQLATLNTYLQTGYNGNGLIPLLGAINDKMGKSNSFDAQAVTSNNVSARERIYDQKVMEVVERTTPSQEEFLRACVNLTRARANAAGGGASAGGGAGASASQSRDSARAGGEYTANRPEASRLADRVRERQPYCDDNAVKNKAPGCTAKGTLPNADIQGLSLTRGATATPEQPTNSTLTAEQAKAADAYIGNVAPTPLGQPREVSINTEAGRAYMVYLNKFNARASTVRDTLAGIKAKHVEVEAGSGNNPLLTQWRSKQTSWAAVFGGKEKFPTTPSQWDMLRLEVMAYNYDPEYIASLATLSKDPALVAQEQIKLAALQAKLTLMLIESTDRNTQVQAVLAAHQMEPLTTGSMRQSLSNTAR